MMMPEQARAAHLAYDRLYQYLNADTATPVASDAELEELIYGNLLAAQTLVEILAKLRGKTFDHVLAGLPERDEGYPPRPGGSYIWESAIYQLRYLYARSWQRRLDTSRIHDLPMAFRGSFNLAVAAVAEVAAETKQTARQLTGMLRDASASAVAT